MAYFSVKNYQKFQHYKDRNPPWIKLYNELLENYDFGALPDAAKGQMIGIWLLASRTENRIPFDSQWVSSKINATDPVDLELLMSEGFLVPFEEDVARGKSEGWSSRYVSKEIRAAIFDRDKHQCVHCQETQNLELDHIIPISRGGSGVPENLQVLCRSCNRRKRNKKPSEHGATQMLSDAESMRSLEREAQTYKIPSHEESLPIRVGSTGDDDDFNPVTGELRVVK